MFGVLDLSSTPSLVTGQLNCTQYHLQDILKVPQNPEPHNGSVTGCDRVITIIAHVHQCWFHRLLARHCTQRYTTLGYRSVTVMLRVISYLTRDLSPAATIGGAQLPLLSSVCTTE